MKVTKAVHAGGIEHNEHSVRVFVADNRHTLINEMNNWLFDHLFRSGKQLKQLPPLDDWEQSKDDETYWSIKFPTSEWFIWVRCELIDFK